MNETLFLKNYEQLMNQILLMKGDIDVGLLGKAYFKDDSATCESFIKCNFF
jgi:hypothetical protein